MTRDLEEVNQRSALANRFRQEEVRYLKVNQVRGVESTATREMIHALLNKVRELLNPKKY